MSLALLALLPQLIATGITTVDAVKKLIALANPGLTDAELNTVLDLIAASAAAHQATAKLDQIPSV